MKSCTVRLSHKSFVKGELYSEIELFLSKSQSMENQFSNIFFTLCFGILIFFQSLNIAILQILPSNTAAKICCVGMLQEFVT